MYNYFYNANFIFIAERFEEWQAGQCISQGPIRTEIIAEVRGNEIHFELDDIGDIRMLKSFDFEILDSEYCILPDRIQYFHSTTDYNPIVPMICHLFYKDDIMEYVRFAMTNPDRIVEFYGAMVMYGQPSKGHESESKGDEFVSAEQVLNELCSYGMFQANAVLERAEKLFNDNAYELKTTMQVRNTFESFKLFVKALELDKKEKNGRMSMLAPKLLLYIALCNFKMGNTNRAYHIAKLSLQTMDEVIVNSPISGLDKQMFGSATAEGLVSIIEKEHAYEIDEDCDIDPLEIDSTVFDNYMSVYRV